MKRPKNRAIRAPSEKPRSMSRIVSVWDIVGASADLNLLTEFKPLCKS